MWSLNSFRSVKNAKIEDSTDNSHPPNWTALPLFSYSKCCGSVTVSDQPHPYSLLELFLRRMDEQGLKISSPWASIPCPLV